jgi:RNA polymerase sigma-70 factor, ECF subfamily
LPPEDSSIGLVRRASQGDGVAVDELLVRHLPGLRAYVRLNAGAAIRAKESTSDLVQSVCREVLQDVGDFRYEGEAAFRHWLYQAALRKILDRDKFYGRGKRDLRREVPLQNGASATDPACAPFYAKVHSPSAHAMAEEQAARIEASFDRLPDNYREIISLSRVVGLSNAEIAQRLGQSEGYARMLLSRALARLARELRSPLGSVPPPEET